MLTPMCRALARLALAAVLALLAVGTFGFARASISAAGDIAGAALPPLSAPSLLGPIDALGRNGWQCFPERAAAAKTARDADLPHGDRR